MLNKNFSIKVMSKLRDPLRFAAFVEGASHLRDEEILHFESSKYSEDESDISLTYTDEEEEEENQQPRFTKSNNGRLHQGHTNGDISEDEDNEDNTAADVANSYHRTPVPLNTITSGYGLNQASTSSANKAARQRLLRSRHSTSTTRSTTKASRLYDHEFSDEG